MIMEAIESRSESPSSRTRSSSRLSNMSNQEMSGDSDGKESLAKKRTNSKRRNRNTDKEATEIDTEKNGDIIVNEEQNSLNSVVEKTESKELVIPVDPGSHQKKGNGDYNNKTEEISAESDGTCRDSDNGSSGDGAHDAPDADVELKEKEKSINSDKVAEGTLEKSKAVSTDVDKEAVGAKEGENDSLTVVTQERCHEEDVKSMPPDQTEIVDMAFANINNSEESDSQLQPDRYDEQKQNGLENGNGDEKNMSKNNESTCNDESDRSSEEHMRNKESPSINASENKKGLLERWTFSMSSESSEYEKNGHPIDEEINKSQLYYASIKGRVPLSRASYNKVNTENGKDTNSFQKTNRTPSTVRNLDDSFMVRSEPSQSNRSGMRDKPNLRKFPAKRCLNAEESDEKDDSPLTSLKFTKRRKLNKEDSRSGFLRSFLWSPFRKRMLSDADEGIAESDSNAILRRSGTVAKSTWFRNPFWFWKRCTNDNGLN